MCQARRHQQLSLHRFHQHPRQNEFFGDTSDSELQELAADMQTRGQQERVHCLPDGTIIRGHRRVAAARLLGWEMIDAVVRYDLADAPEDAVVNELISDNLIRRQLDDLSLARCYRQLKQAAVSADDDGQGDIRDRLAARLQCGKSGRTLDRLERLLDLPRDLQDAISQGTMNRSQGERILRLSPERQAEIAEVIRIGEPVREVLVDLDVVKPSRKKAPADFAQELLASLRRIIPLLENHLTELDRVQVGDGLALSVLNEAVGFLTSWRDRKQQLRNRSIEAIRDQLTT